MLRNVLKLSVLVLCILAIWLAVGQPHTAFAQNPTPVISHQTTIGPIPTQVDSEPIGSDRSSRIHLLGTFAVLIAIVAIGVGVMTSQPVSSRGKKRGPKLPRNFN